MKAQQAMDDAFKGAYKPDASGQMVLDENALLSHLPGHTVPGVMEQLTKVKKAQADLSETQNKVAEQQNDLVAGLLNGVKAAGYDTKTFLQATRTARDSKLISPEQATQYALGAVEQGQPFVQQTTDDLLGRSQAWQKIQTERMTAQSRAQQAQTGADRLAAELPKISADTQRVQQEVAGTQPISPYQQAQLKETERLRGIEQRNSDLRAGELALQKKRIELSGGSGADPETVAFWVRQIQSDPTQWNMLANNKPLQQAVQGGLAKAGADLNKLTAQGRAMKETAQEILPQIEKIEAEAKSLDQKGLMGPLRGRWRDFATRKIGAESLVGGGENGKAVGKFQTDLGLLMTAVARAHGGARGGGSPAMLEHMRDILDAHGKDLDIFLGNLAATREWMQGYAEMGGAKPPSDDWGPDPFAKKK